MGYFYHLINFDLEDVQKIKRLNAGFRAFHPLCNIAPVQLINQPSEVLVIDLPPTVNQFLLKTEVVAGTSSGALSKQ